MGKLPNDPPPPYSYEPLLPAVPQPRLSAKDVANISPASVDENNPLLMSRVCGQGLQTKIAFTTRSCLEVYAANDGTPLWKLDGRSSIMSNQTSVPILFSPSLRCSPDGSLICVIVNRDVKPELLVVDAEKGRISHRITLGQKPGSLPYISQDNSKVAVISWSTIGDPNTSDCIRIFAIDQGPGEELTPIRFDLPLHRGLAMAFSPDASHIVTCECPNVLRPGAPAPHGWSGGLKEEKDIDLTVTTRVFRCSDGTNVRRISHRGPEPSERRNSPLGRPVCRPNFHFPRDKGGSGGQWLVSFPDYSADGNKTRVVDAATGETAAVASASKSAWQRWQAGMMNPLQVDMGYDDATGTWTMVEHKGTLLPPRKKTLTVTRVSSLRAAGKGDKSWADAQTEVLDVGYEDHCYLSDDGQWLVMEKADGRKIDVVSLGAV